MPTVLAVGLTSFDCASLYCVLQLLQVFFPRKLKVCGNHQQKDYDPLKAKMMMSLF